jgi:hypothetical protein
MIQDIEALAYINRQVTATSDSPDKFRVRQIHRAFHNIIRDYVRL